MPDHSRRRYLATAGLALTAGLAGCSAFTDTDETDTPTETAAGTDAPLTVPPEEMTEPSQAIAQAPLPSDRPEYPVMGETDAEASAILYGSWKCVHTADLVSNEFERLLDDYVQPGDLAIGLRDLSYWEGEGYLGTNAPNAGHAGLSVWTEDPESFWRYFGTMMANQPPEDDPWPTPAQLVAFAEFAGVDALDEMRTAMEEATYEDPLRATTTKVEELALNGIPRVDVEGTITAPTENPRVMYDAIESAIHSS